jgi:histidinol phosphatase-like PHP family hydrolase
MTLHPLYKQDLHIHTIYSTGDSAVVKEQTIELVAKIRHAEVIGISDHFEYLGEVYDKYRNEVYSHGMKLGTEVDGSRSVDEACGFEFDYYIYHCWDNEKDYRSVEKLLGTGKPVIIAHPYATGTQLDKVPVECLIEINNRYVYRYDWRTFFSGYIKRFRFILSSDAHQPNWLNQTISRYVAAELGIEETLLFQANAELPGSTAKIR